MTINETIKQIHDALKEYIEATYHISNPLLVKQRHSLLDIKGVISQMPYIESTPRYKEGERFENLGLEEAVEEIFCAGSVSDGEDNAIIHNPPYKHQETAIKKILKDGKSIVVMTGTGSGKTECFLLPILGKLAKEAKGNAESFRKTSAVRAMVLYPMNALVNDQLGRLRLMFGDKRIVDKFLNWAERPPRFARYTSRTLYPGVRSEKKDQTKLKVIEKYYLQALEESNGENAEKCESAVKLIKELKSRGKWPSKPNLAGWYGKSGSKWKDKEGEFKRCVTLNDDPELLTRHEVQNNPPDILVTNYSMLEYMLMRPLERGIFEKTKEWLKNNPSEKYLLIIDEAHLYRGAAGAEVALLIRRLRARLGIPSERLQVICTSASFQDEDHASSFCAQLTGKKTEEFDVIKGEMLLCHGAERGDERDVAALCTVELDCFDGTKCESEQQQAISSFLEHRKVKENRNLAESLFIALKDYPPMKRLINMTMKTAKPIEELGSMLFDCNDNRKAMKAATVLITLGNIARMSNIESGLFPCRIHSFYRGLPGLWVCMDPNCTELPPELRGGPCGKMYGQPREACDCGARVLELFTCRNCGAAYVRAYTNDLDDPKYLWPEPGRKILTIGGTYEGLMPIDLLIEVENKEEIEGVVPADYDMITGRLNPKSNTGRIRQVFLSVVQQNGNKGKKGNEEGDRSREFIPCCVCGETTKSGNATVQNHQTKGDQPFQALITRQLQIQTPSEKTETRFAPLKGRKVLVFSDSRQTAARLAPNLQTYSMRDVIRPLIVYGFKELLEMDYIKKRISMADLHFGILFAAYKKNVRLRYELKNGESNEAERIVYKKIGKAFNDPEAMEDLLEEVRATSIPEALLGVAMECVSSKYYGLESLALASIVERHKHKEAICGLSSLGTIVNDDEQKIALARLWLRCWQKNYFWTNQMPDTWVQNEVKLHSGDFDEIKKFLNEPGAYTKYKKDWLPRLKDIFAEQRGENKYLLKGREISLQIAGEWGYCQACRTTQRIFPGRNRCINCRKDAVSMINVETDEVFKARKYYYRNSTLSALKNSSKPMMAIIAAEHTAQISSTQDAEVFSKAEQNELLFQDVDLGNDLNGQRRYAIDVLSCTTTMEVGIDIGSLTGVSLRNMPPSRANYQQRAGRAGRRGNSIATVTAFGSADSHDEHYFSSPEEMISGEIRDPSLTLNNSDIARRHVTAFLLQKYYQEKLTIETQPNEPDLFSVLGTVSDFLKTDTILNINDFKKWLQINEIVLQREVASWLPEELEKRERDKLLKELVTSTIKDIEYALDINKQNSEMTCLKKHSNGSDEYFNSNKEKAEDEIFEEIPSEEGVENPTALVSSEKLLDRLLYKGILPRYAFPTDVATFYVFNKDSSTSYRPAFHYSPSQGLPIALSQYAPGKEVWIGNKLWTSGAIYSPIKNDLYSAWNERYLYYECSYCQYARKVPFSEGNKGEALNCPACGHENTFGPARNWLRPPGFAHPVDTDPRITTEDLPVRSFATRAKLSAPADTNEWHKLNERISIAYMREHLLVTNRGPKDEGYTYCTYCGRIEPTAGLAGGMTGAHMKPYPDTKEPLCPGAGVTKNLVLGTDFITDILLISIRVEPPLSLSPGVLATDVALRTVCEAIAKAACLRMELEEKELQAEYRPALTESGRDGFEAEIYLYDTLPGGAGFARRAAEIGMDIFYTALEILTKCPEKCDRSCYRCLRSYRNKNDHDLLDRHLGSALLQYMISGVFPEIEKKRQERLINMVYEDIMRQQLPNMDVKDNVWLYKNGIGNVLAPIYAIREDGREFVIALSGALKPDEPEDTKIKELEEFCPSITVLHCDELSIRTNLPRISDNLIKYMNQ